jgi:DNA-binding NarL/FixJ family response regulator
MEQAAFEEFSAARRLIGELAATIEGAGEREYFLETALKEIPTEKRTSIQATNLKNPGGLTAREREIAGLIAQGKSNLEIAQNLVVSKRTVETHITNILTKLDFSSRSQIAVWTTKNGLLSSN